MRQLSPSKAAIALGAVTGLWHFVWITLVGVGWAKPVMDFVLKLHFIRLQYDLMPYSIATAVSLVVLTFTVGAALGLAFALIWNWLMFESSPLWSKDTHQANSASRFWPRA